MDDRGREAAALGIGDEDGKARIHDADQGIGGAQIDADDFAHDDSCRHDFS
jgi:hypothetical protein